MTNNTVNVSNFMAHTKDEIMDLIKKFVTPEQMLHDPTSAYAVGKLLQLFDDYKSLCEGLAKELDETNEIVIKSFELLKEVDKKVDKIKN